jgi:coenzyme PQQ precursor peptide PqqA
MFFASEGCESLAHEPGSDVTLVTRSSVHARTSSPEKVTQLSCTHESKISVFGLNPYNRAQEWADCFNRAFHQKQETAVKKVWTRPQIKEVSLGCEINCYAPAEI